MAWRFNRGALLTLAWAGQRPLVFERPIPIRHLDGGQCPLVKHAESIVTSSIQYRRNMLNLPRFTGDLLAERGVAVQ